jgi:hypothetical protein
MAEDATEFSPLGSLDVVGLEDGFRGELLRPQDPGYEDARKVWNGSINRFPALIARCAGVADVIAAVMFAKDGRSKLWARPLVFSASCPCPPAYRITNEVVLEEEFPELHGSKVPNTDGTLAHRGGAVRGSWCQLSPRLTHS